ncbi:MAG: TIGR02466 family protein [Pseudobdellovibrionaceae bacterium]|nr:TIGR02466 family protein [Pseudobdellovibrionaceae bacterium]
MASASTICFATQIIHKKKFISTRSKLFHQLLVDAEQVFHSDAAGHRWSKKSYFQGYTSYGSLDQLHRMTDSFFSLSKKLNVMVTQYVKLLGFEIKSSQLYLSRMWLNVMPKFCYHPWHIHPLSVISGTFYLQIPGPTPIRFEDPRLPLFMNRPPIRTPLDSNYISLFPRPGDLILFESWLRHEVPAHQFETPRISVSFNFDWA